MQQPHSDGWDGGYPTWILVLTICLHLSPPPGVIVWAQLRCFVLHYSYRWLPKTSTVKHLQSIGKQLLKCQHRGIKPYATGNVNFHINSAIILFYNQNKFTKRTKTIKKTRINNAIYTSTLGKWNIQTSRLFPERDILCFLVFAFSSPLLLASFPSYPHVFQSAERIYSILCTYRPKSWQNRNCMEIKRLQITAKRED